MEQENIKEYIIEGNEIDTKEMEILMKLQTRLLDPETRKEGVKLILRCMSMKSF